MLTCVAYENKTAWLIGEDMKAVNQLGLIESLVAAISKFKKDICFVKTDRHTNQRLEVTDLGKAMRLCMKSGIEEIEKYFPIHTFNPYVKAFIKSVRLHQLDQMPSHPVRTFSNEDVGRWCAAMNACAKTIRMETATPEFKSLIRGVQRSCNKNFEGVMNYFQALFKKNGRHLALRVDVGYKKVSNFDQAGSDVSYDDTRRHREDFIDEIRKRYKKNLLGYVWKVEHGLLKGYHHHILVFLDGSNVCRDVSHVKMLGDHWDNEITEGRGVHWNCNANKASYRFCGIGMLKHDDPTIWEGLENIATYLTKPDYFAKLNMPGNDRALG